PYTTLFRSILLLAVFTLSAYLLKAENCRDLLHPAPSPTACGPPAGGSFVFNGLRCCPAPGQGPTGGGSPAGPCLAGWRPFRAGLGLVATAGRGRRRPVHGGVRWQPARASAMP